MKPVPDDCKPSMEAARFAADCLRVKRIWPESPWAPASVSEYADDHLLARIRVRKVLYRLSGMTREERRTYRHERTRALEAARRTEGVLIARWGIK